MMKSHADGTNMLTVEKIEEKQDAAEEDDENIKRSCCSRSPSPPIACDAATSLSQLTSLFDDFMTYGSVGLHIVDNKGIILWANKAELDLLGYTPEEYIGKPIKDFHADQDIVNRVLSILLSGGKVESIVSPIRCKDGHIEYMEINSTMRKDMHTGKCTTTRCFSACVTDRILKEQAQLEAMARKKEAEIIQEETRKKTDFLRKLCHELRNPLAGITGNLELLLEELLAADAVGGGAVAATEEETHSAVPKALLVAGVQPETTTLTTAAAQGPGTTAPTTMDSSTITKMNNTSSSSEQEEKLAYVLERVQNALDYAKNAQLAAEHQMLVINDTLSLSKLESSTGFDFHPKPVDFERLLDGVVAILGVKAKEKGLALNVDTAHLMLQDDDERRVRYVKTDIGWIKQVLINLVGNSLKFTQHGHVNISVKALEQSKEQKKENNDADEIITLEVTIQDTGIGMTKEEQINLFRPFSQANDMTSTDYGGSGLGLHIVKQVLDHLNGSIHVESEKGIGSTFRFTLPCGVVTPQELATLSPPNRPASPTTNSSCTRSKTAAADALLPSPLAQGKRVLVVDDIEVNRKILSCYLRRKGYVFEVAVNGQIGLDLHRQNPFDLILTDIDMPVMDGNEMTRRIRKDEARKNKDGAMAPPVPIIGISGHVFQEDSETAERAGISEFMCKPFNFPVLEEAMINLLKRSIASTQS